MAKLVEGVNDLQTLFPEIATQWHPEKNNGLFPNQVRPGCNKTVWWKCQKGHEWQTGVIK